MQGLSTENGKEWSPLPNAESEYWARICWIMLTSGGMKSSVAIQCYCRTFWLWLTLVFLLRNGQHTGSFCTTSTLISLATSLHLGRDLRCHSHRRRSDGIGIFIWPNWWSLVSRNLPKSISFVSQETVLEQKQTGNWSGDVRSHDVLRCVNKSKPRPCWTVGPCTIFVIPVPLAALAVCLTRC